MISEGQRPSALTRKAGRTKHRVVFAAVILAATFLAGFLPGYVKTQRQQQELRAARQQIELSQLRDLASLVYFQANDKDYGLAAGNARRLFDRTRELANQTVDSERRKSLQNVLNLRDSVTAKLAMGNPEVLSDLRAVVLKTRESTTMISEAQR